MRSGRSPQQVGSPVYTLTKMFCQQLVQSADAQAETVCLLAQLLQGPRVLGDQQPGAAILGIFQPGERQLLRKVRGGELERGAADRMGTLAPPEQLSPLTR